MSRQRRRTVSVTSYRRGGHVVRGHARAPPRIEYVRVQVVVPITRRDDRKRSGERRVSEVRKVGRAPTGKRAERLRSRLLSEARAEADKRTRSSGRHKRGGRREHRKAPNVEVAPASAGEYGGGGGYAPMTGAELDEYAASLAGIMDDMPPGS